jgi:hypothetical protein
MHFRVRTNVESVTLLTLTMTEGTFARFDLFLNPIRYFVPLN